MTHWDVYLTLSFSTESLVCRRTSVTRWTLRRCYCSWKSIHQKQSYRTEPAEACCLCCNPFIASLCHQFTQKVTLPSESRVRNTQCKEEEGTRRDAWLCEMACLLGAQLSFSFQPWCIHVEKLCCCGWRCSLVVKDYLIVFWFQPNCSGWWFLPIHWQSLNHFFLFFYKGS